VNATCSICSRVSTFRSSMRYSRFALDVQVSLLVVGERRAKVGVAGEALPRGRVRVDDGVAYAIVEVHPDGIEEGLSLEGLGEVRQRRLGLGEGRRVPDEREGNFGVVLRVDRERHVPERALARLEVAGRPCGLLGFSPGGCGR